MRLTLIPTFFAAALFSTSAFALAETITVTPPADTGCAAYQQDLQSRSTAGLVVAIDLLPVSPESGVEMQPGVDLLYNDQVGLLTIPIDPASYKLISKKKLHTWLFLSFPKPETMPLKPTTLSGVIRRSIGMATGSKTCAHGEDQLVDLDTLPLEVRRHILRVVYSLKSGGNRDPYNLPEDEETSVQRAFPSSVDNNIETYLKNPN